MSVDKFGRSKFGKSINSGPRGPPGPSGSQGLQGPPGVPGEGFVLTSNKDYDMQLKNIKYLADPQEDEDAVNKSYVDFISKYLKFEIVKAHSDMKIQLESLNAKLNLVKKELRKQIDDMVKHINSTLEKLIDVESITIQTPKSINNTNT